MNRPSEEILQKAIKSVETSFTKEVMTFSFTPSSRDQFGISLINERGGRRLLIDFYFTVKTGKLVKSVTVEDSLIKA